MSVREKQGEVFHKVIGKEKRKEKQGIDGAREKWGLSGCEESIEKQSHRCLIFEFVISKIIILMKRKVNK